MNKLLFIFLFMSAIVCQAHEYDDNNKYLEHIYYLKNIAEMDMMYLQNCNVNNYFNELMHAKASGRYEAYSIALDLYKSYKNQTDFSESSR